MRISSDRSNCLAGEGLAWWAAEHREPAFVRENLLDDPRVKYVPELEEEHFQSLLSVPIQGKSGDVIGVSRAHRGAPGVHAGRGRVRCTAASLVGAAIENARLYGEMQRRVNELEALTELAEAIARTEALEELLPAVARRGPPAARRRGVPRVSDRARAETTSGCDALIRRVDGAPDTSRSPNSDRSSRLGRAVDASPRRSSPTTSCSA